ncbi:MAG: nucleotidyl transferase AbiEii/AbiGii toxin family protein [Patescibacteria group bacterium]
MISDITIKKLANKYQSTDLNIQREYLQHLFLSYFYLNKDSKNIFFKGGTALRIVYNSPRFSEDLDFSANIDNVGKIEDIILDTIVELEREGFDVEIKDSVKTSGGYLAILIFKIYKKIIAIRIEMSLRNKKKIGEMTTIVSDFLPVYTISVLLKEILISEKIEALITRQKPRDFYDLYFILRAGMMRVEDRHKLESIYEIIQKTDIQFDKELRFFLPKNQHLIIKDFKDNLLREVQKYVPI